MNRKKFTKILDRKKYLYVIEGDNIIITQTGNLFLEEIESIPPGVIFRNKGISGIPRSTIGGSVHLDSVKELPEGTEFHNGGGVYLDSIESISSIHSTTEFNNLGEVFFLKISTYTKPGNKKPGIFIVEGISPIRVLNCMCKYLGK